MIDQLTNDTVELLQALIRNQCVNDGTPESGFEDRSAKLLRDELEKLDVDPSRTMVQIYNGGNVRVKFARVFTSFWIAASLVYFICVIASRLLS